MYSLVARLSYGRGVGLAVMQILKQLSMQFIQC